MSGAADPLVRLADLAAGYGEPVVGPMSLAVDAGEVLGLAGPNGCGKSTLLGVMAGAGRIFAGAVHRRPGLRVSYQRQEFAGPEEVPLTGRELLALTGAPAAGLPAWLAARLDERLDRLSGGQRQFVHLWACLMAPADLVLLDEPTNNLDGQGTEFLGTHLRGLLAGRAAVLVSHDGDFLRRVCDRVLQLELAP